MKLIHADMFSSTLSYPRSSSIHVNTVAHWEMVFVINYYTKKLVYYRKFSLLSQFSIFSNPYLELKTSFSHVPIIPKCISIYSAVNELSNHSGQCYKCKWLISNIKWIANERSVDSLLIKLRLVFCLHCIPTVDTLIYYIYLILHNFWSDFIFVKCKASW
jgi:hypothetical protein